MWRLWTRGWGPRDWWYWFKTDGFPRWIAWRLPRRVVFWAHYRVLGATGENPDNMTWTEIVDAWEKGAGR